MAKKKTKEVWYKIIGPQKQSVHRGVATWKMPKNGKPGDWMSKVYSVRVCHRGYHLVPLRGIKSWLDGYGYILCQAEGRGARSSSGENDGKTAFAEARITKVIGTYTREVADLVQRHRNAIYNVTGHWPSDEQVGRFIVMLMIHPEKAKAKIKSLKKTAAAKEKALKAKREREVAAARKKYGKLVTAFRKVGRRRDVSIEKFCSVVYAVTGKLKTGKERQDFALAVYG